MCLPRAVLILDSGAFAIAFTGREIVVFLAASLKYVIEYHISAPTQEPYLLLHRVNPGCWLLMLELSRSAAAERMPHLQRSW